MSGVVSAAEFGALQEQLMKLKEEKYEGIEREKKLKREIEKLSKEKAEAEATAKKNSGTLASSASLRSLSCLLLCDCGPIDLMSDTRSPVAELLAKAQAGAPAPKSNEAELKAQVDALKQSVAQQERDKLAKGAAPAPRKEAVEKAAPSAVDRAALVARIAADPPLPDPVLDAVEAILKEQTVRVSAPAPHPALLTPRLFLGSFRGSLRLP